MTYMLPVGLVKVIAFCPDARRRTGAQRAGGAGPDVESKGHVWKEELRYTIMSPI